MNQQLFHQLLGIFEFKKSYQLRSSGLNYLQLHVLERIYKEARLRTLDISRQMDISPSTLIGVLDELESKGLIMRIRQKDDKRVVLVTATDKGKQKVLQHIKEDEVFLRNLTSSLNKEESVQLAALLQKVTGRTTELGELFRE
ncbi:MAG: MarR family winged helix-turn-helix transcriptional regulator [Clostridia bacterium]